MDSFSVDYSNYGLVEKPKKKELPHFSVIDTPKRRIDLSSVSTIQKGELNQRNGVLGPREASLIEERTPYSSYTADKGTRQSFYNSGASENQLNNSGSFLSENVGIESQTTHREDFLEDYFERAKELSSLLEKWTDTDSSSEARDPNSSGGHSGSPNEKKKSEIESAIRQKESLMAEFQRELSALSKEISKHNLSIGQDCRKAAETESEFSSASEAYFKESYLRAYKGPGIRSLVNSSSLFF